MRLQFMDADLQSLGLQHEIKSKTDQNQDQECHRPSWGLLVKFIMLKPFRTSSSAYCLKSLRQSHPSYAFGISRFSIAQMLSATYPAYFVKSSRMLPYILTT